MATLYYTLNGNYDPEFSATAYSAPVNSAMRVLDFGPGSSIEGFENYQNQFVYLVSGPDVAPEYQGFQLATDQAGLYVDFRDFDYVTRVTGGNFGDYVFTGDGNDVLNGGGGDDFLIGGGGNDVLEGGRGSNSFDGGTGTNTLSYEHFDAPSLGGTLGVIINMESGSASDGESSLVQDTFSNIANVRGSQYGDIISGDAQNNVIEGGVDVDSLTGGDGIDTLSFEHSSDGVIVDLQEGFGSGGDAEGETYGSFENILGSTTDDALYGDGGANTLNGNGGNDELYGRDGNDRLVIGNSPVKVDGGEGTDLLFILRDSTVALTDTSFTGLASIEKIYVRDGASLTMTGVDIGAKLYSQSVADGGSTITGTDGADRIAAGKGNDVIAGGRGGDSLFGGAGADTFVFAAGDGRDVIRKFDAINDTIDLSALGGDTDGLDVRSFHGGDSTLITLAHEFGPTDKIILLDVAFGSLTEGSFIL
ncbi:calcium-binding protein [Methylobacterium sp. Leaf93]|uniref:calcium-binding protein n=1 Tax=Methylobacterium sp. Leaf93 TaxID=1736249 RepID=UPI000A8F252A|nr:calcium-binding protein [Methylobacterium sp. Leaf93]